MKIATWNVNSLKVRLPHVLDWLASNRPDVLALQETKLTDDAFPVDVFHEAGYQVAYSGQKTYNGVAIASLQPIHDPVTDIPQIDDPQRRILAATVGSLRILNLYVVNGAEVGSDKYRYKLDWLDAVTRFVEEQMARFPNMVLLGDFNIAPEDRDVYDPDAWRERILCSTPERNALNRVLDLGFHDAFRQFDQADGSFSWWDYRAAAFRRNRGLRIDLVLASDPVAAHCTRCTIDTGPRRLERPSDHAPVLAELALDSGPVEEDTPRAL